MPPLLIENFVDLFRGARRDPPSESVVETLRTSTAARWTCARRLRAETRSMLVHHRALRRQAARAVRHGLQRHRAAIVASLRPPRAAELWSANERSPECGDGALRGQVLRSIEAHPEGVAALDIANELGVDWRRVHGAAHALVEEGAIEQVDQELYPPRKASRP
jgi:hypothetical protein